MAAVQTKKSKQNKRSIPASKSQTLDKAIQILDNFTIEKPIWGIRDLGRDLGMTPTTIYRIVATLNAHGFLEQDRETQRYTLGPKFVKLASIYTRLNPLPDTAMKIFERYSNRFNYNIYLGRLSNFELIYLAVLDGRGPIKIVVEPGGTTTLHSTAMGKVLLAYQNSAFIDEYFENTELETFTQRSITNPEQLRLHLEKIRKQGYAVNDGEHYDAIGAVGVPVIEKSGEVQLGVSLAYPRSMIVEETLHVDNLVRLAKEISQEISQHM